MLSYFWGWAEKFIGWLWCNGWNLPKCGYFQNSLSCGPHTSSIGVAVLGFLWYRSSHPDPWKSPQLQIWYDLIISPILLPSQVCFHVGGKENCKMVPNQENMEGDQPIQSHSHAQQPLQPQICVQEHCPGEKGLPSSVFQAVLTWLHFTAASATWHIIVFSTDSLACLKVVNEHNAL